MLVGLRNIILAIASVWVVLGLGASGVLAHGHRHVGGYNFAVGFIMEPAYEGLANGVEVRVTWAAHEEGGHGRGGNSAQGHEGMAVDVEGHGALFVSPGLNHEDTFSFEPGHDMEGLTIPYHNHLDHDMTGSITVTHDAQASGTVEIEIHDKMYLPAEITVQPGTRIVWTNHTSSPQSVTSGGVPMGSRADGETEEVPVEGLEETLKVEITHVPTKESRVLELRAVADSPGHYTADLIPTAQGVYEMRVFGGIEGTSIDETFVSYGGGGGFSDVLPVGDLQFPVQLPEVREIEGAVRGALDTAQQAQDAALSAQAASANTLGIIGIVLGAVGTVAGAGGLTVAMRKR